MGEGMVMQIKVGKTGLGVNNVNALTETVILEAGDLFVLDAFTDNATTHQITGWARGAKEYYRDVFVFRTAVLTDYFRLDDEDGNHQRLAPREGVPWCRPENL